MSRIQNKFYRTVIFDLILPQKYPIIPERENILGAINMRLSSNFSLEELCASDIAKKHNINNQPTREATEALGCLVQNLLQPLRDKLRRPIIVTSGYRCPELNKKVGGAKNSQHTLGQAVDITVAGMSPRTLAEFITRSGLTFDQMIVEEANGTSWLHLSYTRKFNRKERLLYRGGKYTRF